MMATAQKMAAKSGKNEMGNISDIKYFCSSNGPGIRTAVFLSGCNLHCKGCFNSEAWDFNAGYELTDTVVEEIVKSLDSEYIQGLSILGGEPMDTKNQASTLRLAKTVREKFGNLKDVWVWTGYEFESIPDTELKTEILDNVDTLVVGPFDIDKKDLTLQYAGSTNQRVIHIREDEK